MIEVAHARHTDGRLEGLHCSPVVGKVVASDPIR